MVQRPVRLVGKRLSRGAVPQQRVLDRRLLLGLWLGLRQRLQLLWLGLGPLLRRMRWTRRRRLPGFHLVKGGVRLL